VELARTQVQFEYIESQNLFIWGSGCHEMGLIRVNIPF
jgi:hypothetical protein